MTEEIRSLRITVVAKNYPSSANPARGTFVYTLVQRLCEIGDDIWTISPCVLGRSAGSTKGRCYGVERSRVLRPRFPSFSNLKLPTGRSTARLSLAMFKHAARRAARRIDSAPDVVYGHFLFRSGAAALDLGRRWGRPAVVALGESDMARYESDYGLDHMRRVAEGFAGILAVSDELCGYVVERLRVRRDRVVVIPNAADTRRFHLRDRDTMRRKYALPTDRPIVSFIGHFDERKGPLRVLKALDRLPNVVAVFLGDGPQRPRGQQVLFAGRVPHHEVPEWLCASDAFVLPTLAEGSCNAISEALACGVPVVAGDVPAVRAQAADGGVALVDPHDPESIARAIHRIVTDRATRESMRAAAIRSARRNTLDERARRIHRWLERVIQEYGGGRKGWSAGPA